MLILTLKAILLVFIHRIRLAFAISQLLQSDWKKRLKVPFDDDDDDDDEDDDDELFL